MRASDRRLQLPKHVWFLAALYCCASLIHFTHNAQYIAFYPNMPPSITPGTVYRAWIAIKVVGGMAAVFSLAGWRIGAALLLIAYGCFGLDGLGHYALALCSEHTLAMNFTIWFEVLTGSLLAICAANQLRKITPA